MDRKIESGTHRVSFAGENPEGSAEEGKETKPKLGPTDSLDGLGLATPVEAS